MIQIHFLNTFPDEILIIIAKFHLPNIYVHVYVVYVDYILLHQM